MSLHTTILGIAAVASLSLPLAAQADSASAVPSAVDAHAINVMRVDELRDASGAAGAGVHVAVIYDGARHWQELAKTGILPETLWLANDVVGDGSHGTQLLELIHAIAPDAALGSCAAVSGQYLNCLKAAVNDFHADIIVSGYGATEGNQAFGFGAQLTAVRQFLLNHPEVAYIAPAGDNAKTFFIGHYRASAIDRTINGTHYLSVEDWGLGLGRASDTDNAVTVPAGGRLDVAMQWDGPFTGKHDEITDFDLYLMTPTDRVAAAGTSSHADARHAKAFEDAVYINNTNAPVALSVVVACHADRAKDCDHVFFVRGRDAGLGAQFAYTSPGGIYGRPGLASAITVGAVKARAPDTLAPWSQQGAAAELGGTAKPNLVAPGQGTIVPVGDNPSQVITGTAVAAAQVAGVAALIEGEPFHASARMVLNGTVDLGADGFDRASGWGRIDAVKASGQLGAAPAIAPLPPISVTTGEPFHGHLQGALSGEGQAAGLTLTYVITAKPAHGTLKLDTASGAFTYTSDDGYTGEDHFQSLGGSSSRWWRTPLVARERPSDPWRPDHRLLRSIGASGSFRGCVRRRPHGDRRPAAGTEQSHQ
jgi:hypothetical protein